MRYYGNQQGNNTNSQTQSNERQAEPVIEKNSQASLPPPKEKANKSFLGNIFSKFSKDDLILIAVIFMLMQEEDTDTVLLLLLGYIFIMGL